MTPASCERLEDAEVELYFYDELDPPERARAAAHLRSCPACRTALEELRLISDALSARPMTAAPPGGEWTAFMGGLQERLSAAPASAAAPSRGRGQAIVYLAMAALLALVTASVTVLSRLDGRADAGRTASATRGAEAVSAPPPAAPAVGPDTVALPVAGTPPVGMADAAFATLSEQHFARSKLVVLGLATKPAVGAEADWQYERALASSLLPETRLYRRMAQDRGLTAVADVMSDLELVLLQASLSDERDAQTLPQIQRLIRRRDLVTKIQVVDATF